ncbi:MAG: sensor histidine kinase [Terriglobia bacterium]
MVPGAAATSAQRKALKQNPENRVSLAEFNRAIAAMKATQGRFEEDIASAKQEIIGQYKDQQGFKKDFLDQLKPEIEKNLAFLHDYKQFVARVKQNINVVLKTHYGSGETEQLLSKALPSEVAIYWASSLMTEKLQTAFLLLHPERLQSPNTTVFRLHGMITKYIRIYHSSFQEKEVKLEVQGESTGEIKGDPSAIGVIPQTLLDNALKYSTRGAKVTVEFRDLADFIILSVTSYGPKINPDEKSKIFDLFYRGRNAIKAQEEGAGFGLHLAQFVARSIDSEIVVHQKPLQTRFGHETTFSVRFAREQ